MNTMIEDFKDSEIERLKAELSQKQTQEMFDLKKMASNMGRLLSDMSNQYRDVNYKLYLANKTIDSLVNGIETSNGKYYALKDASTIATLGYQNEKLEKALAVKEAEINGLHMIIESQVLNK